MPEYLAPGVYVEEVDTGAKPIEGVSTSTSGMVGVTEKGPVNVPTLVTGAADYKRQFGWYLDRRVFVNDTWYLPHAVKGFFDNGGKRLYVVRVLPDEATAAATQLFDRGDTGISFSTTLASRAEQGETLILVDDATGINPGNSFLISDGASSEYGVLTGNVISLDTPVAAAQSATAPNPTAVVGYALADGVARVLATNDVNPGDTNILLDDVTGLNANGGDLLLIEHGTNPTDLVANTELVQTFSADPTDATVPVVLSTPLTLGHLVATPTRIRLLSVVGSTPLTQPAAAGDSLISVEDAAQIALSDILGFGGPPSTELHSPGNVGAETVLTTIALNQNAGANVAIPALTADGVARTLTADAAAGVSEIELDDRTGLAQGSILRFTDSGATSEFAIVDDVVPPAAGGTNPGVVTLRDPLNRSYTQTQVVENVADTGLDASATELARDANPGERGLVLVDNRAYAAGATIRVGTAGTMQAEYHELDASTLALIPLAQPLASAHASGSAVLGRSPVLNIEAIDRGSWGNTLLVTADDDTPILETRPTANTAAGSPTLTLQSVVGVEVGTVLEFYRVVAATAPATGSVEQSVFTQKVESVLTANRVGFGPANLSTNVTTDMRVRTREFRLIVDVVQFNPRTQREEVVVGLGETLRQLALDPRHSRYAMRVVGPINPTLTNPRRDDGRTTGESDFIRLEDELTPAQAQTTRRVGPDILRETLPTGRTRLVGRRLQGGNDQVGLIGDTTYIGADAIDPLARTGIFGLKNIEEVSIVAIPGRTSQLVQQELITHCELMRYRFAVIDSEEGDGVAEVQTQRGLYDTKYAALYYPWLRIVDPFPDNPRAPGVVEVPPSGHVIGIYARSDIERGVHKAPANEVLRSIADLEFSLTKEEQDILNPRNINVLRNFRVNNRGLRVWGARTLSSDPDWKYVNVRRLFIFIEHSIDRGTQWVVFEPNSEALWQRVRRAVSAFLTNVWRDGALMGKTKEEAYFVKCDRTTMTQADIDNGRLIVQVGIAPVKPAEFVIFRIGQWAGGSELDEG